MLDGLVTFTSGPHRPLSSIPLSLQTQFCGGFSKTVVGWGPIRGPYFYTLEWKG